MGLIAIAGGIGAAAVGDEHQVVLDEVNGLLLTVLDIDDLTGDLLVTHGFDDDILHIHTVFDAHTMRLQIFHQRQDHALISFSGVINSLDSAMAESLSSLNCLSVWASSPQFMLARHRE